MEVYKEKTDSSIKKKKEKTLEELSIKELVLNYKRNLNKRKILSELLFELLDDEPDRRIKMLESHIVKITIQILKIENILEKRNYNISELLGT